MNLPGAFAQLAGMASAAFGGPFHDARVVTRGSPTMDDGGSIATPAAVLYRSCQVQVDEADQAMRNSDGFAEGDRKFLIVAASLNGGLDTDAEIEMLAGPFVGRWHVAQIGRDGFACYWIGRGRMK